MTRRARPTAKQIEGHIARNEERATLAERQVKDAAAKVKAGDQLAILALYDAKIARVERDRDRHALRGDLVAARAEEAQQQIVRMTAAGRPAGQIHAVEIELADLQAEAASPRHATAAALAVRSRQALKAEREHAVREAWHGIAGQLAGKGQALAARVDEAAKARDELAAAWAELDSEWQRVERAAGPQFRGRQSLPPFPLPPGDTAIRPWPGGGRAFDGSRDPLPPGMPLGVSMSAADTAVPSVPEQAGRPADWGSGVGRDKPAAGPPAPGLEPAPADDDVPDLEPNAA